MEKLKLHQALFIRLVIVVVFVFICWLLFSHAFFYSGVFVTFILLMLLLEIYSYINSAFNFYERTIDAILQNDFSADFSVYKNGHNYTSLFKLYNKLKKEQHKQQSQELVYQSLLNNIETGILILETTGAERNIFLMNDYFSNHFKIPKVTKWKYLEEQAPAIADLINAQNFKEVKTSLQIRVNKEDNQTFIMQTACTKTLHGTYYVVLLDSIQKVIDKKEKEAWSNLMKVISHELLNSITPIRSLSQNLQEMVTQDTLTDEDLHDMKMSVSTMLQRSNHLQQFVESYRKLAMLPSPKKEKTSLQELIDSCVTFMKPLLKESKITLVNAIDFNRWLLLDKLLMEQVFINLLTNSMYSLQETTERNITIEAEQTNNRIYITITDSGKGIPKEIEDKIFLPFFTTRKDGAGIGLTLSKNIVEAHGGYLVYQNKEGKTKFVVCLVE
ncbi:sensor histidine kinase [Neptunitalea chrysea]|nr:ATP-binding protein [Neptunitalea chrysea]